MYMNRHTDRSVKELFTLLFFDLRVLENSSSESGTDSADLRTTAARDEDDCIAHFRCGHFEYRPAHARAMGMPSAMPR